MDITLVICAYNEESEIAETIDAAKKVAAGRFREIIVVDNASKDRTGEIAQAHGARVVREPMKGLPYARLAGLNAAESEYIAYIDADTHLSESWFDAAERIFAKYPHIVALSGPRKYFGISRGRLVFLNGFWLVAPLVYRIVGYMILGGNFIARKDHSLIFSPKLNPLKVSAFSSGRNNIYILIIFSIPNLKDCAISLNRGVYLWLFGFSTDN